MQHTCNSTLVVDCTHWLGLGRWGAGFAEGGSCTLAHSYRLKCTDLGWAGSCIYMIVVSALVETSLST